MVREHDSYAAGEKMPTDSVTVAFVDALIERSKAEQAALTYAGESAVRMAARLEAARDLLRSIMQPDCICGECERIRAELAREI